MSRSLPKSVHLLYFQVNRYFDMKYEQKLHTGEFTKNILFIRHIFDQYTHDWHSAACQMREGKKPGESICPNILFLTYKSLT